MNRESHQVLCLSVALALSACAGNGNGLDENGRPIGSGEEEPLTANLQSIQDHVFTPICTQCHAGAAAPLGLRLEEGSTYAMLVNAPSSEVPGLQRVTPGDPDASYLIQKLEGSAAVGGQMPLGQPPLPQATIDVIRRWIENGAQATATGAAPSAMTLELRAITPTDAQTINSLQAEILLQADGELETATLNAQTLQLIRSGGDGSFDEGNESIVSPLHVEVRSLNPTVLAIEPKGDPWPEDRYRLVIKGTAATPAKDGSGIAVSDFSMPFTVGAAP